MHTLSAPNLSAGHRRPMPPPETPGHSQASLVQCFVGTLLLFPGSWWTQGFICALQESPSPVEVLWSNPSGFQSQIPCGFSVHLLDTQVGKSVVDPRTFLTVPEFLWYNCSIHEVNPKTVTGHPETDQLPELTQGWERFRPARMEKPETFRRDLESGLSIGSSHPPLRKFKKQTWSDQTNVYVTELTAKQNSTLFKGRQENPDTQQYNIYDVKPPPNY